MREYGQIQSAFWQSEDAEAMSDRAKLLVCYLLTGPYTNGLGCFRVTDGNLMDDLGWDSETISETFSELYQIGFAYRLGKVVFLPNFLKWNAIANPNVSKARIKELETLPTNDAKSLAARALLKFCNYLTPEQETVLQTLSGMVSETVLQTLSKQNPTQPNPTQNQNKPILPQNPPKPPKPKLETAGTGFEDRFWPAYPRKVGKADAAKAFAKLRPDAELLGVMLRSLATQAASEDWRRDGGRFIPHPATWLNGKRWQDDVKPSETAPGRPWGDDVPDYLANVL